MSEISTQGYTAKHFRPQRVHRVEGEGSDVRDDRVYVYSDEIVLAVNVAIATRRPLLVRGGSGSGKSSLARNVADFLGWRYIEHVVTSRTEARDLLWDVDLVRRLHRAGDADAELTSDFTPYIVPGPLWWAFDRKDASRRGAAANGTAIDPVPDPHAIASERAVVLLDEIDKADPDVPNNLLLPLGSLEFVVEETGHRVAAEVSRAPLIFLTTNEERELPPAFLRRCVEVTLDQPDPEGMVEIAEAHYPAVDPAELLEIADAVLGSTAVDGSSKISTAEFLDTVQAKLDLEVDLESATWERLKAITAVKPGR